MSEVKRAKLISFGAQRVNDKNSKEVGKTVRISVILPESTEDKCPEFNYKDELVAAKRKNVIPKPPPPPPKQPNGLDPFNDDDEDVKRIAAEMEAKYGMGVAKKRKWRKDDYADIGMGYDESDSFIDNTDGYDEIIPKNVTTLHGGFYINCGALEFKTDEDISSEDSSSSEEDTPEKSNSRKRILESSADSEEETQTENAEKLENPENPEKKQKLVANTNGMQKAIKKRLFSHDKIKQQMRKKRADDTKKTVRELLKERRLDLNMTPIVDAEPSEKAEPASSPKENKKPAPLASVDDVIESVINSAAKRKEEPTDESSKDSSSSKDALQNKSVVNSSEADSNDGITIKPVEIVQLPENLPSDIIGIIDSIKKAAACSTEGKVKFFSGHVNTMLLNLERKCRCLGKQSRMRVYEHLAPFVKCRKETLMKRAKNLCILEEQKKIKLLMDRLKAAVGMIMPSLLETYEDECRAVLQRKFSTNGEEASKSLRMPKRHFPWSEEMKKLLRDIITLRKKCYINEGKQKDSLEKHLTEFIKSDVQVLWPDGWMSISTLLKYCNIVVDAKKSVDILRKPPPTSSPEVNISPAPSIPISSNSALTITPVTSNVHKVNSNELKPKPKPALSETVISKVTSDNCSLVKPTPPLPPADIVKTLPPDLNNLKYAPVSSNKPVHIKEELEAILIEESMVKMEQSMVKEQIMGMKEQIIGIKEPIMSIKEQSMVKEPIMSIKEQSMLKEQIMGKKEQMMSIKEQSMAKKEQSMLKEQMMAKKEQSMLKEQMMSIKEQSMPKKEQMMSIKEQSMLKEQMMAKKEQSMLKEQMMAKKEQSMLKEQMMSIKEQIMPKKEQMMSIKEQSMLKEQMMSIKEQSMAKKEQSMLKEQIMSFKEQSMAKKEQSMLKEQMMSIKEQSMAKKEQMMSSKEQSMAKKEQSMLKEQMMSIKEQSMLKEQMMSIKEQSMAKKEQSMLMEQIMGKKEQTMLKEQIMSIKEQSMVNMEQPENLSSHVNVIKHEVEVAPVKEKNSTNHCQVIDLTDQPELKKKPGPKSKTKYLYEYPDKPHKLKKEHSEHMRLKTKEEITGSSALTQIIADSLSDLNRFAQGAVPKHMNSSTVINNTASVSNPTLPLNSTYDYTKPKSSSEGDDIQKVMEGLKVLQKMSSPVKSEEGKTSSPVSVIAFNKSYSHESSSSPHSTTAVAHRSSSFQDAFQKHFIPDYNLMKASQAASTSKGNYNSISKHNHTSTKSNAAGSDRYLQNSNNNYAQQNSNKLKNSCSSQQSGSYDLLDDMFANFLNEYGHSKAANSKSSTPHK